MKLRIRKSGKEEDLIRACKRQEARAQRELYEQNAPLMLGICRRYIRNEQEAEDVMIKGFMKVFTKIHLFEGKGSFEGWMKRIMINEALGFIRKNKSMYLEVDIEKADKEPDYEYLGGELDAKDLMKMVAELPSGYRTVFNLYAVEGYSHKEISELLGINENTSKSQLSRARAQLQCKLLKAEKQLVKKKQNGDGK